MTPFLGRLAFVLALTSVAPAQEPEASAARFPASTAVAEGVSPEALARLDALVRGFVDDEEIVGAELLVIKNGNTILHEAHGWRDRDEKVPMELGSVFCVRSMTKPLVGAAIRMLIEEGRLAPSDPVARFLPAFDTEGKRQITIQHLLTHTSGLPLSLILGKDPRSLESVRAVADLGGTCELEFEPGTGFEYSDQGTDTLTAVIEMVTGAPAEDFVRTRLLEPLGMRDSACILTEDDSLRSRACSKYVGSPGSWTRYWSPADAPLFPVFLGSQALYSTVEDYACFLDLWMHRGRAGGERILRPSSVRRTLEPGPFPMRAPTGFPDLRAEYGSLMQLWTAPGEDEEREIVVFGHTGSDGTHAWAFPEQDAMVLYFTQSRGTPTGLRVEEALGELLLGAPYDPLEAAPPFEDYLGFYWEGEGDLYRATVRDGDDLALEVLGRAVVPLTFAGDDRWKLRPDPSTVLAFERDESGTVTGFRIGDHQELRFEPSADLPSLEDVQARVTEAHGIGRLAELGPLRMRSRIDLEKLGLTGESVTWLAWPDRWRSDEIVGEESGSIAFDGETVWQSKGGDPAVALEGAQAKAMRESNAFARYGEWSRWYDGARVIQRIRRDDEDSILVRTGDTSAPAMTIYVDWNSGLVGRIDTVTFAEGMGRIGQRLTFGDFRDVSGMKLPFRTMVEMANPLIGPIELTVQEIEVGVDVPDGLFELEDAGREQDASAK